MNDHNHGMALITGASSGIGAAFARTLAERGHDLVLVARRQERLEALADELESTHGIDSDIILADLAEESGIARVETTIKKADDLSLLINNAGFEARGPFVEVDLERHTDMLHVHVLTPVRLTHTALPGMIERGRGGIINVSSVSGFVPLPRNLTYSATKRYLITFSRGLQTELRGTGVRVQALCPGFTVTEFHETPGQRSYGDVQIPRWLWMSADEVVKASLRCLSRGRVTCIPSFRHWLIAFVVRSPLAPLVTWLMDALQETSGDR